MLALIYFEYLPNLVHNFKLSSLGYYVFGFFNQRFLVEMFYNKYIVNAVLNMGGQTTKVLDKGSIEILGPFGLEKVLLKFSKIFSSLNTGVVTNYALYILIGFVMYTHVYYTLGENLDFSILIILFSLVTLVFYNSSSKSPVLPLNPKLITTTKSQKVA
jgi:NADH-ubiquinone oxidoreductase chain 5